MEITGIIKSIGEVQNVTEKFKKRELVIETGFDTEYPQTILLEFQQDAVNKLNGKTVGGLVKVFFNLKGRQWTDASGVVKTFNTLHAWKIDNLGSSENENTAEAQSQAPSVENNPGQDDLPF
jgi:hypothetical protein